MPKVMMEEDKMKLTQVKVDVKIKTQCIIQQMDFIHLVSEIVFQPEVMCKAVAEQTWYLVHKEHNDVEIPELKTHLEEYNRNK